MTTDCFPYESFKKRLASKETNELVFAFVVVVKLHPSVLGYSHEFFIPMYCVTNSSQNDFLLKTSIRRYYKKKQFCSSAMFDWDLVYSRIKVYYLKTSLLVKVVNILKKNHRAKTLKKSVTLITVINGFWQITKVKYK